MRKYVLICDSVFLNNSSGINTFIVHMCTMFKKNNVPYVLFTDDVFDISSSGISKFNHEIVCTRYKQDYKMQKYDTYVQDMVNRISMFKFDNDTVYIANSMPTTKVIDKISKVNDGKFISYTHIGDFFHDDNLSYDFSEEYKKQYFDTISNNDKIMIGTQSENIANYLTEYLPFKSDIHYLPEPLYTNERFIKLDFIKKSGAVIICSNYKRKRLDIMLKYCGMLNIPVRILCSNIIGYYDIKKLIVENNVNAKIYTNIKNSEISFHISNSKMLIHFSDIEVFPYSILESSPYINCVINKNAMWGSLFPDELCTKVDYNDESETLETLISVYNSDNNDKLLNLEEYQNMTFNKWYNI